MLIIATRSGYSQRACTFPPAERLQVCPRGWVGNIELLTADEHQGRYGEGQANHLNAAKPFVIDQ
jgi:hypothetical protein